ncbi:Uma2 family endonuclease [Streptomyces sp. 4N509B]|uniref:Uma2 family endonuclease n=1 Tax=Streptomyces sp. 4N509B TaxID=3457413 RepID=UPI003FD37A4C
MALTAAEHELNADTEERQTSAALEDHFEGLSATAPEGWRVELIEGGIHVVPPANGEHESILSEVLRQVTLHAADTSLRLFTGIGLRLPGQTPQDKVIPDLVVAPRGSFASAQEWHDPAPAVLVAEITSKSTEEKDRSMKLRAYARVDIPHYLLVDRKMWTATLFSEPAGGVFQRRRTVPVAERLALPEPLGFELDTSVFAF